MKKSLVVAAILILSGMSRAYAGHFIDVLPPASTSGCSAVSNGYDYQCSNDSSAPSVGFAAPAGLYNRTLAQINVLTPGTTGQAVYCSNCVNSSVCVSSGLVAGAWVSTMSSGTVTGIPHCN